MTEIRQPADRTIVHLVRHGEVANPRGILYGRIPGYHLSEDGRLMAKAAADYGRFLGLSSIVVATR